MDKLHETLRDFAEHFTDYIPEIPVLDHVPSANEFLSDYLIPNKPFIISCPENHLPAITRWQKSVYLQMHLLDTCVTVAVAPIMRQYRDDRFVVPEIRKMSCFSFLLDLERKTPDSDHYHVNQRNNLEEFSPIADDIRTDVPWATEALGSAPIAANLSIGNMDIFTPMHKDQYENFFYVLKGSRQFKLIPPIAHVCIPYKKYKKFQWVKNQEENDWKMMDLNEEIEIIPEEIEPETLEKNGFYRNIKSYDVKIHAGEALYIPALWYHEYHQSNGCFTLNYWYDLKWDWKFPWLRFLSKLFKIKEPTLHEDAAVDIQTELENSLFKDLFDEIFKTH